MFRLDGKDVYRLDDKGALFPEYRFAVLNFAKISPGPMTADWVMDVDWVKHECLIY